jgi:hypothetical protein
MDVGPRKATGKRAWRASVPEFGAPLALCGVVGAVVSDVDEVGGPVNVDVEAGVVYDGGILDGLGEHVLSSEQRKQVVAAAEAYDA